MKASGRVVGTETLVVEVPHPSPHCAPGRGAASSPCSSKTVTCWSSTRPAGMVVHPGAGHQQGTLVNALLHHVEDLQGRGRRAAAGHRAPPRQRHLGRHGDREAREGAHDAAEGVRLARGREGLPRDRRGRPPDEGTFDTLHGRHPVHRQRFTGRVKTGKRAVTHYRVKQHLRIATLVEVTLETGRTHQIRVHFAEAGLPAARRPDLRHAHVQKLAARSSDSRSTLTGWHVPAPAHRQGVTTEAAAATRSEEGARGPEVTVRYRARWTTTAAAS
jgi:23S rRNA pseudouridine1911/1915/1917 synthase